MKKNQFFKCFNDLLLYLISLKQTKAFPKLFIETENNENYLQKINNNYQVQFPNIITQNLYHKGYINSKEFINIMSKFKSILFKLEYPNESIEDIINAIKEINNSQVEIIFKGKKKLKIIIF